MSMRQQDVAREVPSTRNRSIVPQAQRALDQFKYEVASELQIPTNLIQGGYWGNLSSRDCGIVGGYMVKRMIEGAERALAQGTLQGVRVAFQQGMQTAAQAPLSQPQGALAPGGQVGAAGYGQTGQFGVGTTM